MANSTIRGQVLFGINNIYTVSADSGLLQCRIKGKILRSDQDMYNPIAVGDLVDVQPDPITNGVGWIVQRRERRSSLVRWNKKRRAVQVLAANADLAICLGSVQSPPFRPRFLDRLLVSAEAGGMELIIVLNKCDLGQDEDTRERVAAYRGAGYRVLECSALSGQGLEELRELLEGRVAVFVGQSGAGKSSLLNRLEPALELPVGCVSSKYDRGVHTTSFARMHLFGRSCAAIDTPGLREFEMADIRPEELAPYFREFVQALELCALPGCQHREEPGCAVRAACQRGAVHPDRYESYLRIHEDLTDFYRELYGSTHA